VSLLETDDHQQAAGGDCRSFNADSASTYRPTEGTHEARTRLVRRTAPDAIVTTTARSSSSSSSSDRQLTSWSSWRDGCRRSHCNRRTHATNKAQQLQHGCQQLASPVVKHPRRRRRRRARWFRLARCCPIRSMGARTDTRTPSSYVTISRQWVRASCIYRSCTQSEQYWNKTDDTSTPVALCRSKFDLFI